MIIKLLLELIIGLLEIVFGWVSFPAMPETITIQLDMILSRIYSARGFLWLVFDANLVRIGLPIILVMENFDKIYSAVMWVLRKIPFLGIE